MQNLLGAFCIAAFLAQCISAASVTPFIVGGEVAERGQFPYLAQITYYNLHACGGAILDENWIVTTAKCVGEPEIDHYEIIANQYNIHQNEGSERRHNVSQIILHPNYLPGFNGIADIALVKLSDPLTFDTYVQPIPLPPANHTPADGENCTVGGWGPQAIDGRDESILKFVQIPIINLTICDAKMSNAQPGQRVFSGEICAGDNGYGICYVGAFKFFDRDKTGIGDMGSPLVANDLPNKTPYLVGVAAWLVHCGRPGTPEVYTDVGYYSDWIEQTIVTN